MNLLIDDNRWRNGDDPEERIDDSDGNLPLSEDYPAYALSLLTESADTRLQARKGMAIRTFGSGTVDPRPNQDRRLVLN